MSNLDGVIESLKGIVSSGGTIGQMASILNKEFGLSLDPGDAMVRSKDFQVVMAAPIAIDAWYLFNHINMLTYLDLTKDQKEKADEAADKTKSDAILAAQNNNALTDSQKAAAIVAAENVASVAKSNTEATDPTAAFNSKLGFFAAKLGGIKALKGITSPADITQGMEGWNDYEKHEAHTKGFDNWKSTAKPWINLMVYEIRHKDQPYSYNSDAPVPTTSMDQHDIEKSYVAGKADAVFSEDAVGYLAFPAAQIGVMEVIALVQESLTEVAKFEMKTDEQPGIPTPSELFPPREKWIKNKCYGRHLIESSYLIPEAEKQKFLYPSAYKLSEKDYGKDVRPKGWAKLWIKRKDKFPVPGEFIGVLCKSSPVPPTCWWFQETNPFVYAGNWMDTYNLTSGVIVQTITPPVAPATVPAKAPATLPDSIPPLTTAQQALETAATATAVHPNGTSCTKYRVRVHGIDIYAYSSDFLVYTVGSRVGILKLDSTPDPPVGKCKVADKVEGTCFNWKDQKAFGDPSPRETSVKYVIIPITFFQEVT
jgi:hypothetical protein